ncbi:LGAT1-like protein [Mya arenaria]|uniref:LGAT1-like protein n=1 Tax=Mya arenaria TaxID=6604 RepID=A0ABY7FIL5_MYAAR|nr:LGAT1-like protein [Mya arenaria]
MVSLRQLMYYVLRVLHLIVNNLMAIPAYTVWLFFLTPLRHLCPAIYWQIERVLFKALISFVVMWTNSGGYKIIESGDDLSSLYDNRVLLLVNHQSTADIPCVMSALLPKSHGKEYRESQLDLLNNHLLQRYLTSDKRWIVLFPEGGFLYKRRISSQKFAEKNNLPILNHVALPRVGAMNTIMDTLGSIKDGKKEGGLQWVVDMTLAYPGGEALDMHGICIGWWKPCNMHVNYRAYPVSDIPNTIDDQLSWLYDRYTEKEQLLEHFYKHGEFPENEPGKPRMLPRVISHEVPFDKVWFMIAYAFYAVSAYIFWIFVYSPLLSVISGLVSFVI